MITLFLFSVAVLALKILSPMYWPYIQRRTRRWPISLSNIGPYVSNLVAILSLWIAIDSYLDAQKSGPEQQKAFEASRKSLENVVGISKLQFKNEQLQKTSLDSSVTALNKVLSASNKLFEVSNQQLTLMDTQWKEQQRLMSLRPKFAIGCQFRFHYPPVARDSTQKPTAWGSDDADFTMMSEGTPDGITVASPLYDEDRIRSTIFPIKDNTTWSSGLDYNHFYLVLTIRNVGNTTAEDFYITIKPLIGGISVKGDGIEASEPLQEGSGGIIYSIGKKHIPVLTMYSTTKEEVRLTLKITYENTINILRKILPVQVEVLDKKVTTEPVKIRFRIELTR